MEKVYRLLDWLDMGQAADWLSTLTGAPIGRGELFRLVLSKQCDVYIQPFGLRGHYIDNDGFEVEVIGRGFQLVVGLETIRESDEKTGLPEKRRFSLEGARYEPDPFDNGIASRADYDYWEAITEDGKRYSAFFKPEDIRALAAKINGIEDGCDAEPEDLRQQLEQERATREAIETEFLTLRYENGKRNIDDIRNMLHDHTEFSAMQMRAEQAEKMAAAMDKQLTEQAEAKRQTDELLKAMASKLRQQHQGEQSDILDVAATTTLTFPYATKELEAMRSVAMEYWAGHTLDKRQPKQDAIQRAICKALGLETPATKIPPNKAIYLATAIKPEGLPKA